MDRIVSSEFIRPTGYAQARTRCTAFDRLISFTAPTLTFCYAQRLDPARLRAALSDVLRAYPLVCGKLVSEGGALFIEHGVAGAPFEVCESSQPVRELAETAARDRKAAKRILPSLPGRAGRLRSLIAVRVTEGPDGSLVSLTLNHGVGDLMTMLLIMRAWSAAYRGEPIEPTSALSDRAAYLEQHMPQLDARGSQFVAGWAEWPRHMARFLARGADPLYLRFTWEQLAALQAEASREHNVTQQDALMAHVFGLVRGAHRPELPGVLMLSLNYRSRLGMPPNTLGNFFDGLKTRVERTDDLAAVAAAVRRQVAGFPLRRPYSQELERLHASHPSFLQRMRCVDGDLDPREVGTLLTMTTHKNAGLYDITFDDARPVLYGCRPAESINWLTLTMETPDDSGLLVQLHVPDAVARTVAQEHAAQQARAKTSARSASSESVAQSS